MISSDVADFYPVGHKVRMPNIHTRSVNGSISAPSRPSPRASISCSSQSQSLRTQSHRVTKRKVNDLGRLLTFSDDVVSHRSPNSVSYTKAKEKAHSLFKSNELGDLKIGSHLKKSKDVVGRHDCRGEPKRHVPCHLPLDDQVTPRLHVQFSSNTIAAARRDIYNKRNVHEPLRGRGEEEFFLGRVRSVAPSKSIQWHEDTLTKVSSFTAKHLVGLPSSDSLENYNHKPSHEAISNVNTDNDLAAFTSATQEGQARCSDTDSTPLHKDFVRELEMGALPVHQPKGDKQTILLSNNARFNKVLQPSYPHHPSQWYGNTGITEAEATSSTLTSGIAEVEEDDCVIGYRRWMDLPQRAKTPEELQWECKSLDVLVEGESSKESCLSEVPSRRSFQNREMFDIMQEWCTKWQIHIQPSDIKGEESLLDDLHNLCDNTKMFAVSMVAYLARHHAASLKAKSSKPSLQRLTMTQSRSGASVANNCPPALIEITDEMVEAVRKLLNDSTEHVRVPSAIVLYCLDKQCEKAEEVLLSTVVGGVGPAERWASVQVLVCARVCTAPVINELLYHLHNSQQHQSGRRERAADLLARSSTNTPLVHAMLAEQLNSSGWQERLAACQMLPRLHGGINKDLCFKLVVLSWEDWSPEVRQAAAIALGQTGHAKMIHDEIANRLTNSEEAVRLDALKKLHNLHLMTPHLLSSFLKCFNDDHISVKIESIVLAGTLRLSEPQVFQALQKLLQDPCWKVKAYALRAFADIGVADEELVSKLLWAVRFEKLPAVRAEACHTIASLQLKQERVVKTLRDLLSVDDEPLVLKEVSLALKQLGCSLEGEDDMLETIRSEVQRLGTRKAITAEIVETDITDTTDYVIGRPRKAMTTRDYLNDKQRNKVFLGDIAVSEGKTSHSRNSSHKRRQSLQEPHSKHKLQQQRERDLATERSRTATINGSNATTTTAAGLGRGAGPRPKWSPDRKTIDAQLKEMKKRVSIDVAFAVD